MKNYILPTFLLLATPVLGSGSWPPANPAKKVFTGRQTETYQHGTLPEWGYAAPQEDTFVVMYPKEGERRNAPLYVVLHSAGHDVYSCVNCTRTVGNHDIYRAPDDHYALYLDCRKNRANDWWWGGLHRGDQGLIQKNSGGVTVPVEKRVIATVKWVIKHYGLDSNRVYLSGNSMGGSGTLGIGMRHGDVFAAIKANVPAGIEHVSERMFFPPMEIPEGVSLVDPPICVDYSGQNDGWSTGHDRFARAMNERRYALFLYWGPFGHANNSARIMQTNDLIDSFDWLGVRKDEAYPVFTNASTNSELPWPDRRKSGESGQINAFFRWKTVEDTPERLGMSLVLVTAKELETRFEIPDEARADVSLRRLQKFRLTPGASYRWRFGKSGGVGQVDPQGLITVPDLKVTGKAVTLWVEPSDKKGAGVRQPEARFHVEGKGWRMDRARISDPGRPRVLLIGDSILQGYFKKVVSGLGDKAYVDAWVNPHWQSEGTNRLLADVLSANGPYDVVHFNMGLHGWAEGRIKEGTFQPLTRAYVKVLRQELPGVRLIWASSTPVTAKEDVGKLDPAINPVIVEHNHMAAGVMRDAGIPVNDFYELLVTRRELAKGDRFHWTNPAYSLLGEKAARSILEALGE